jgi:glycosyltransferase involved in cell wall biosynthesis
MVPFLAETIESVQRNLYPSLEYVIADGGSTDGSHDVINRFCPVVHATTVGPDKGHADGLNKGFSMASGEIMGWINSDDLLMPWALRVVDAIFTAFPQVDWVTGIPMTVSPDRQVRAWPHRCRRFTYGDFLSGDFRWLQQEGTFWRKSLWEAAGGYLSTDLRLAIDFELWVRFLRLTKLTRVEMPLAAFRIRPGQRSEVHLNAYLDETKSVIEREIAATARGHHRVPKEAFKRTGGSRLYRRAGLRVGLLRQRPEISREWIDATLSQQSCPHWSSWVPERMS